MEPVTLQAEGLRLVPWEEHHLPDLARIYADPLIEQFMVMPLPWSGPYRDRYLDLCARHWRGDNPRWAVVDEQGGLVGSAGLTHAFSREVSITYLTAPWARGRGVAQKAIRAAVTFAFDNMDMKRVAWDAIVGNHASKLAAIRTGFTVEGISRNGVNQRGTSRDCWVGGILPGEVRAADDLPEDYAILKAQAAYFLGDQPELETEVAGLRLRRIEERDLDDLAAACADPETQRWTTMPRNYTRAMADDWLRVCRSRWDRGTSALYVLADEADRYSGSVELGLRATGAAELGYFCAPWARGQGWTTAAAKRLCRLGFEELALERIEWRAVIGNEASKRVAEKAGFDIEGIKRQYRHRPDERLDSWVGSLIG
ncbi:GNAT family N-acetyltransferase [Glycomyces buryatensis]|uniref:GNAT family N-acetyltransferase n=1 Tax=Glycomyces buryatensis TaxID=2570927 RepID=A0A4V4HSW2_9ACTN|nr:GNAT family N-acetyltransferase [Glycomyces buryatensis]THV43196.1 GNAT family N-acetyltransferase [Glycomyces buryatensis]